MRKLTVATASMGSTLLLMLPDSIVGAVVVRTMAFAKVTLLSAETITGSNNQALAKSSRCPNGMCRLISSNIAALSPDSPPGTGFASSKDMASASLPTAVVLGGIELWPPGARATISRVTLPFSATLMGAKSGSTPGNIPSNKKDPSSRLQASWIPAFFK